MESSNGAAVSGLHQVPELEDLSVTKNLNSNQLTLNQLVVSQQQFVSSQNNVVQLLKQYLSHPYICIQYQQFQLDIKFPTCIIHDKVAHIVSSKIRKQQYLMKDPKLLEYFDFNKSGLWEITLSHIMEPNKVMFNLVNVRSVTVFRERNDTRIMKMLFNQDGANLSVQGHQLVQNMLVATLSNQQRHLNPDLLTDVFFQGRVLVDSEVYKTESKFATYEMELYNRLNSFYGISQSLLTVNPDNNKFQVKFPLIQKIIYSEGRVVLKNLLRQFVSEVLVSGYTPQSFYGAIHTEFILLDLEFKNAIPSYENKSPLDAYSKDNISNYEKRPFSLSCDTMQREVFDDIITKQQTTSLISEIGIVYVDMCHLRVDAQYYNMRQGNSIDVTQAYVALHQLLISSKPIFMKNPQLDIKILQQYYSMDVIQKLQSRIVDVELFCLGIYQKIDFYAAQQGLKTNHNPTVDLCFMAGMLYQVFVKNLTYPDESVSHLKLSQILFFNYLLSLKNKHNFIVGGRGGKQQGGRGDKKGSKGQGKPKQPFNPETQKKVFVAKDLSNKADNKPAMTTKSMTQEEAAKWKDQQKEKSHDEKFDALLSGYNSYSYDDQMQYKKGGQQKIKSKEKVGTYSKKIGRTLKRVQGLNLGQLNTLIEQLQNKKITKEQFETAAENVKQQEGVYQICYNWANQFDDRQDCQYKHDYFGDKNPNNLEFLDMMCPISCSDNRCVFAHTLEELLEGEGHMADKQARKIREFIQQQQEKYVKKPVPVSLNKNTIDQILEQKQADLTQDLKKEQTPTTKKFKQMNIHDRDIAELFDIQEEATEEEKSNMIAPQVSTNLQKEQRQRQARKDLQVDEEEKVEDGGQLLWEVQHILDNNIENISTLQIFGNTFQVYQFNSKFNCCSLLPILAILSLVDMTFLGYLKRLLKRKYDDDLTEELYHLSTYFTSRDTQYHHNLSVSLEQVGYKISTTVISNAFTYFGQVNTWIGTKGATYNDLLIFYAQFQLASYSSYDDSTSIDNWDISKPNPIAYFNATGVRIAHVQLIIPISGKIQQKQLLNETLPLIKSIATEYNHELKGAINHQINDLSVLTELQKGNQFKDQQLIRLKQMILLNVTLGIDLSMSFHYVHNNKNAYTMQIFPVSAFPVYMITYMDRADFLRPITSSSIYKSLQLKFPQVVEPIVYKQFQGIGYFKSSINQVYRGAVVLNDKQTINVESIDEDQLFPDNQVPDMNDYYMIYYCKPNKRRLIPREVYYTMSLQNTAIVNELLQQHDHYQYIDDSIQTLLTTGACMINQQQYQLKTTQYYPLFILQSTQQILQRFFFYLYQNDFSQSVPKTVSIQSIPGISTLLPTPNCSLTVSHMGVTQSQTQYQDAVNEFGELYKIKKVQNIMDNVRIDQKDYLIDLDLRRTIDTTTNFYRQTKYRLITYILVNTQFNSVNLYDGTILNLQQMSITAPFKGINIQIQPTRLFNTKSFKFKVNQCSYYELEIGYNVRLVCVLELLEPQINVLLSLPKHISNYLTLNRESIGQLLESYYQNFPQYKIQSQVGQRQQSLSIQEEADEQIDELSGNQQESSSSQQQQQSGDQINQEIQEINLQQTYPVEESGFAPSVNRLANMATQVASSINGTLQQVVQRMPNMNRQIRQQTQHMQDQLEEDDNFYGMADPQSQGPRIRDFRIDVVAQDAQQVIELEELRTQPYQPPFDTNKYQQLKTQMEGFLFTQLSRNVNNPQISTLYMQKLSSSEFDDLIKEQLSGEYQEIYTQQLNKVVTNVSFIQSIQQQSLGASVQQPINILQAQTQELKNRRIEQYNPQLRNKINILTIIIRNLGISLFPGIQSQYLIMNAVIGLYQRYLGSKEIQKDSRPITTSRFGLVNGFLKLLRNVPRIVQQYPAMSSILSSVVLSMMVRSKLSVPKVDIQKVIFNPNPIVKLYSYLFSPQFNLVTAAGLAFSSLTLNLAGSLVPIVKGLGQLFTPSLNIKSVVTYGLSSLCIDSCRMALNYQQQLSINNRKLIVTQNDLQKLAQDMSWGGQMVQLIKSTVDPYICTKIADVATQRFDMVNGNRQVSLRKEFILRNVNDIQFSDYIQLWQEGQIIVGAIGGYIQQKDFTPSLHKKYQKQKVDQFFYQHNMKSNPDQILKVMQQEAISSVYPVAIQHINDIDNLNPVVIPQTTKEQRTLSLLQATVYRKFYQGCVRPSA